MPQQFYRAPWTRERVEFLIEWWPHFGSAYLAHSLGLTVQQVKSKVNRLRLRLLSRPARLCVRCRANYQSPAYRSLLCHTCWLAYRKEVRRAHAAELEPERASRPHSGQPSPPKPARESEDRELRALKQWITEGVRNARLRSAVPADITPEYMLELWQHQEGRCFYSGRPLVVPRYGDGRNLFAPSIDRLDSHLGYSKGNVVWAALACNLGKGEISPEEYVQVCADVVRRHPELVPRGWLVCGDACLGLPGE